MLTKDLQEEMDLEGSCAGSVEEDKVRSWSRVSVEAKRQLRLAMPLFAVGILQYAVLATSIVFVGHLGEVELAGASLAVSFTFVTGFYLMLGMALGLETLCGQAFGAEEYGMLGVYMQRAIAVTFVMSVFISIIWANTRQILIGLHQDPEISRHAGRFACFMIPSIFAFAPLQCFAKFLQTQNNIVPMVASSAVALLVHCLFGWVLVFKSSLGSAGAALSISISYWTNSLLLALYINFSSSCATTWNGFSPKSLQNIPHFLRIAVPSALMACFKVWAFEVVIILSGLLDNPKLQTSVLSICFNIVSLAWTVPSSLTAAVSIRVSNELGAGRPAAARLAAAVVMGMGVAEAMLIAAAMISVRNFLGHVYASDDEVVERVAKMMPVVAASSALDTIQSVLTGICTGCGRQHVGAWVNLTAFNLIGIPLAIIDAFVLHLSVKGLMLGVTSAFVVEASLLLVITLRTDWQKQASNAAKRLQDT